MTPQELEAKVIAMEPLVGKVAKLEADNATLAAEAIALKTDNEVLKMSAKEKKAFGGFGEDKKKAYMAADAEKKKSMMDEACKGMSDEGDDDAKKIEKLDSVVKAAEVQRLADSARITKAETELADVKKASRVAHFTKLAEDELPHTVGTPVEKAGILMDMADALGGETGDKFKRAFGAMKSADAALKPSFNEIGKWGGGQIPAGQELEARATAIAKRDSIDLGHAMEKAMNENPDLYRQYNEGRAPGRP